MKDSKKQHHKLTTNILVGGAAKGVSESEQFAAICRTALHLYKEHGRRRALEYLQWQHPWLKYYLGGTGPASGTLLDQIIKANQ